MRRHNVLAGFAASVTSPALTRAAAARRLGLFSPAFMPWPDHPLIRVLLAGLAGRGYEGEGRLSLYPRTNLGDLRAIPSLVQELASLSLDAIVAIGHPMAAAMGRARLPVVAAFGAGDPVATGLAATLAHPGGTVTGVFDDVALLTVKRLHMLAELVPSAKTVAVLWNADDRGMTLRYEAMAPAARDLGIALLPIGVREPDDFDAAFEAMESSRPDGLIMIADALTNLNRRRVVSWAERSRTPAIYELDSIVAAGGLISYGSDLSEGFERAAALVSRIFEGARPGDLPFEQATRYRLAVNMKAARAVGLAIPVTLLAQAHEVIE